jgi:folate-binding protein YgfZ
MPWDGILPLPWCAAPDPGLLLVQGADARSLLHRISTRELEDLQPGAARGTLFCDFRGRLLHQAVAAATQGDLLLLRADAGGRTLTDWVGRHVFREQCRVRDLSADWTLRVAWDGALGDLEGLEPGTCREAWEQVWCVRVAERLLWVAGEREEIQRRLGPARAWGAAEERARIRAAWPAHGREVTQDFNPYEVGLGPLVHLAKGCYTGQEALQRLVTYGATRRRLAWVEGTGPAPTLLPAELSRGSERGGRLTSAAPGEREGWVGLAVLPREWAAGELQLEGAPKEVSCRFDPVPESGPLGRAA